MEYRDFVKKMFEENKGMSSKDIMKKASIEWGKTHPKKKNITKKKLENKGGAYTAGAYTAGNMYNDISRSEEHTSELQ